jgi:toxin ParE1/3/4
MDFQVELLPIAVSDIDEIADYIRERGSQESAETWFNGIMAEIRSLRSLPTRCPVAGVSAEVGVQVRLLLFGRRHRQYKVYFVIDDKTRVVSIIHVRHWARRAVSAGDLAEGLRESHD